MKFKKIEKLIRDIPNREYSDYQWNCYGDNARIVEVMEDDPINSMSFIIDARTSKVYEITINLENAAYRWIDPEYFQAYVDECSVRGVSFTHAWDNVYYTDIETKEEIIDLIKQFASGDIKEEPEMVEIEIELSQEDLVTISLAAHKLDMTLNAFMLKAVEERLNELEKK